MEQHQIVYRRSQDAPHFHAVLLRFVLQDVPERIAHRTDGVFAALGFVDADAVGEGEVAEVAAGTLLSYTNLLKLAQNLLGRGLVYTLSMISSGRSLYVAKNAFATASGISPRMKSVSSFFPM